MHLRFVPSTGIHYLDLVAHRRRKPDGTYDAHIPRMRVRDQEQMVRNDQSVLSMAISTAPRHLITMADTYALNGMQAYNGPLLDGPMQPMGQAVLQIWPRVEQHQNRDAERPALGGYHICGRDSERRFRAAQEDERFTAPRE